MAEHTPQAGSNHRIGGKAVAGKLSGRRRAHNRRKAKHTGRISCEPAAPHKVVGGWQRSPSQRREDTT